MKTSRCVNFIITEVQLRGKGGSGGQRPPKFGRSVNPIQTGDRLCPSHYSHPPLGFKKLSTPLYYIRPRLKNRFQSGRLKKKVLASFENFILVWTPSTSYQHFSKAFVNKMVSLILFHESCYYFFREIVRLFKTINRQLFCLISLF